MPGRRGPRERTRAPTGGRLRGTWRAPRGRACRRGTTGRSSTRSSLAVPASIGFAAGWVGQHGEAVVEATGDLLDGQRLRACRGEFDRQWQTVERATEFKCQVISSVDDLVHPSRGGASGEQLDGVGQCERRDLEYGLTVDVERDL